MFRFDILLAMDTVCSRPAHAKINLHLAVGLPYPDGYHPIQSLFALVGLSDTITLRWKESETFDVQVQGLEAYCSPTDNTLTKAARLWHEAGGSTLHLEIKCDKQIPVKAGLGGGSSDAASLLAMLQAIDSKHALPAQVLHSVALQVGSDVPFFLYGYSAALVTGKGENVAPLDSRPMSALLVMPTFFDVSTSSAYRMLDEMRANQENVHMPGIQELLQIYEKPSHKWRGLLYNDFQSCSSNGAFYTALETVAKEYEGFFGMSGSGACWFFVSEDASQVHDVHADVVAAFGPRVRCWITHLMS